MNKYATHIPVLNAIGKVLGSKIYKILEFGGGFYSTKTFLDTAFFPSVITVDTFETDETWRKTLHELYNNPYYTKYKKWHLPDIETYEVFIKTLHLYDLIFIDDGNTAEARSITIEDVCNNTTTSIVLIHDFEVLNYQEAAKEMKHVAVFNEVIPNTGILWNGNSITEQEIKDIIDLCSNYYIPQG